MSKSLTIISNYAILENNYHIINSDICFLTFLGQHK